MKLKKFFIFISGLLVGFGVTMLLCASYIPAMFNRIDTQSFRFMGAGQILYEQKKEITASLIESKPVTSLYAPNIADAITLYRSTDGSLIVAGELGQIVWLKPQIHGTQIQWDCVTAPPAVYNCR